MCLYDVCVCRQFVEACGQALAVNERLIKEDQQEYHDEMKASYKDLARELSHIMHEQVTTHTHKYWFPNGLNILTRESFSFFT